MIKHLRKRLALLYTATTGAILTAVIFSMIFISLKESEKQQLDTFRSQWVNISSKFQFDHMISQSWLAVTEAKNSTIIYIEENGIPLLYSGSWEPLTRRGLLIERAAEKALKEGVDIGKAPVSLAANQTSIIKIDGDYGDQYYTMALALATNRGVKSMILISFITPSYQLISSKIFYLLLLNLLGITGLFVVSWYFVGCSLKPVEESQKKQAEFIAAASHELRSPLSVIRSSISAMAAFPEKKENLLKNIDHECQRMSLLISDMLLLASTDAKTWSLNFDTVNLDTLLIDTYETFQPLCTEKGIHLELHLPDETLPQISGDPQRLKQVLFTLLDNAASYTPKGNRIFLETGIICHKRLLWICVKDQGIGIPDSQKAYVFDRFYRGDISRNDKKHFGLGLSIAKELIAMHHGTITVTDNLPKGACFMISLKY